VLKPLNDGVARVLGESSGGNSSITRLGLSSIGGIFVVIEPRFEFRLSLTLRIATLLNELRLGFRT
jgi:hypothetical protein